MERAIRRASRLHAGQTRKGSDLPYISHPFAVGLILDRGGFAEEVVVAGLLHDVVEDTEATLAEIEAEFGPRVASIVAALSETKKDASGQHRPWAVRKREAIEGIAGAPVEVRAVALADKLHNLLSIRFDMEQDVAVWSLFNAGREDVLAYYTACIDRFAGEPELASLASEARSVLEQVRDFPENL